MTDFFEQIAACQREKEYLAAYGVEGVCAGKKALYVISEETAVLLAGPDLLQGGGREDLWKTGMKETSRGKLFIEKINGRRKLVICGAGHVSMPLIRIGRMLSYEITVIEDRPEYAARAVEAGADKVLCGAFEEAVRDLPGDKNTAFVVVTRGHKHDQVCLREILHKEYIYAGLMASRRRGAMMRESLLKEGFSPARAEEIHTPIGLPIHSETPEEIAVSILAEIIQIMNTREKGDGYIQGMADEILHILRNRDERAVLAMIVSKEGEAPRNPGTRILVREDGTFLGSIGGGYAEAMILRRAQEMLTEAATDESVHLLRIRMNSDDPEKDGMLCGGTIEVLMEVIGK